MKTDRISYQPNFQAHVATKFIDNAQRFFKMKNRPDLVQAVNKKVSEMLDYNYDSVIIFNKTIMRNGQAHHMLCAQNKATKEITILAIKDRYRKILRKFLKLDQDFFTQKMKNGGLKLPEEM